MENRVYSVPYRSGLLDVIEPGHTLIVKGRTGEEAQRFTIIFHIKAAFFTGTEVPLYITVRFDKEKITLNSFLNGEWGAEQNKSNPIKRGEPFDIQVRAHDDRFKIVVDHKEFEEFRYRSPLCLISHFSINGDLFLEHIHMDSNFNVIRNAMHAGKWGNEECEGKLPFKKGVIFILSVKNEQTHFEIRIDDKPFCSFAHRSSPTDIHGLQIQGDIELTGIQSSTSSMPTEV